MEAPDKIWINPSIDLPKLNGIIDKDSVQYVRKDAFIKKFEYWINENFYQYAGEFGEEISAQFDSIEDCIKDFKKYMEGE